VTLTASSTVTRTPTRTLTRSPTATNTLPPTPTRTGTNPRTATITLTPTNTPRPSPTPRPTKTPDLAATQKYEEYNAEVQKYYDLGYVSSTDGEFTELDDFEYEWAQLYWYQWFPLDETVSDVYFSAHFAWESAYQNADTSGCGVIFGLQEDGDHYAVFLDRSKVLFLINNGSGVRIWAEPGIWDRKTATG
jgi:hypothetical protein